MPKNIKTGLYNNAKNTFNMNTEEKNKAIAKFMGYELEATTNRIILNNKRGCDRYGYYNPHESWDWLMPVVEKIEGMGYNVNIGRNEGILGAVIETEKPIKICVFTEAYPETKILAVFEACYQFITKHKNK